MYDRLLIPTDGSAPAAAAGEAAVALASQFGAELHVVYVQRLEDLPFGFDEVPEEVTDRTRTAVDDIADRAAAADVEATTAVLETEEAVHETILSYAAEHAIDAIVMGTHGRSGISRAVLGSVTERTVRHAPIPVVTITEEMVVDGPFESILVPTDGSECAQTAVAHGIELALATGASLQFVNVVDIGMVAGDVDAGRVLDALEESGQRAVDRAIAQAEDAGVETVEATVLNGTPSQAICDYARERDVDCIVMGTHGRGGLKRLFLGSVTERVIRTGVAPVVTTQSREREE